MVRPALTLSWPRQRGLLRRKPQTVRMRRRGDSLIVRAAPTTQSRWSCCGGRSDPQAGGWCCDVWRPWRVRAAASAAAAAVVMVVMAVLELVPVPPLVVAMAAMAPAVIRSLRSYAH